MRTQASQILQYLETGKSLTAIAALKRFGCFRLAARINDLKRAGHDFDVATVRRGQKTFARYRLAG